MGNIFKGYIQFIIEALGRGYENADVALRYLPIADSIGKGTINNPKILELGSGVKGITCYIPNKIIGVDISFDGKVARNLEPICYHGAKLPFPDKSFDYVISVDMLEHVPSDQREITISEMLRVARSRIYIAVPCGPFSEQQDRELDELFIRQRGRRYHFLKDHVENGLPNKEEMMGYIKKTAIKNNLKISVKILRNVNLKLRRYFMKLWIRPAFTLLYVVTSVIISLFWRLTNKGECYRQLFIIEIE